jgi:transposase
MSVDEFKKLTEAAGLTKKAAIARAIGIHRATVYRWLDGTTPIGEANALLIRAKLKNRKK